MAFKRSFAPAIANSVNVKALRNNQTEKKAVGTAKSNKVAEGDLRFWIPLAAPSFEISLQSCLYHFLCGKRLFIQIEK